MPSPTAPTAGSLLVVDGLSLHGHDGALVDRGRLNLGPGRHVALVGRNGSGKSTLLRLLAARAAGDPDPEHVVARGTVAWAPRASVGYLPQHPAPAELAGTLRDAIDARAGEAAALHRRLAGLVDRGVDREEHVAALGAVIERLDALDAWDFPDRRDRVLGGVGFAREELDRPLGRVSGGQMTRIALAGVLLAGADALLLDEPTNNLDADAIAFLERWLAESAAAAIVASHDRAFLDAVVSEILEIDEETCELRRYGGDYTFYRARKEDELAARMREYETQRARRDALAGSAAALGASAQRFQGLSQHDYYRARGKKVARRATVQLARIEREIGELREPQPPRRPTIEVPPLDAGRGLVLDARGVAVGHPPADPILRGVSLAVHHGRRVVLLGPNGAGKTSFLRVLIGHEPPRAGTVSRAADARVAYLPQALAPADDARVVDHVRRRAAIGEDEARRLVGGVVFGGVGDLSMGRFSAGERRRIELAVLFAERPHLVALDEPTNHLDLQTIEILEEALDRYTGAVIAVSHDRRFRARVRPDIVVTLDGRGGVAVRPADGHAAAG